MIAKQFLFTAMFFFVIGAVLVARIGIQFGTGRAMLYVLALGFASYGFAEMVSVRRFGLMIAACVVVSLLAELVLTPALLRAVYGGPEKPRDV